MKKKENTTLIICVDGVDYKLDIADLTGRETQTLKKQGDIKGIAEIPAAFAAGDLQVCAALAGIAIQRTGQTVNFDKLMDMKAGTIEIKLPAEADSPLVPEGKKTPAKSGSQS